MKGCVALWLAVLLCLAGNVTAERVFGGAVAHSAGDTRGWLAERESEALWRGEPSQLAGHGTGDSDLPLAVTIIGNRPRSASHRASQRSLLGAQQAVTNWRAYGRRQAAKAGWTGSQWVALDLIVTPESGWNPCSHYPSSSDCFYAGTNSCGIPQRNPCPEAWRGRLGSTGREQVRELLRYIRGRYGDPLRALAFRRTAGWY